MTTVTKKNQTVYRKGWC